MLRLLFGENIEFYDSMAALIEISAQLWLLWVGFWRRKCGFPLRNASWKGGVMRSGSLKIESSFSSLSMFPGNVFFKQRYLDFILL